MKKNIGSVTGLYPTPVTIVGTEVNGKINWINIAHVGIWGINKMLVSMSKTHYSNQGIKKHRTLSINLINKELLVAADYVGIVSGANVDKSAVFESFTGTLPGAPLMTQAPVCMECEVLDLYESETHDHFIVKAVNTYVEETVLSEQGTIDYEKVKPVLFEMPNRQYLSVGSVIGKCWSVGKTFSK